MKRIFHSVKKYLFKDTRYFFLYGFRYFQKNYKNVCIFLSEKELERELKNGKSIIRIGDGEIDFVHFLGIGYQDYSPAIRADFLRLIKNYREGSPYLLGVPLFVNRTNGQLKKDSVGKPHDYFRCWMPLKVTFEQIFNKKAKYFDAHAFYRNGGFQRYIMPLLNDKKVIVVSNAANKEMVLSSGRLENVYDFVVCPERNAYEERENLVSEIKNSISGSGFDKRNFIVLMSAGLSKTVVYDLSREGYQVLDIGKGLEIYCRNMDLESAI